MHLINCKPMKTSKILLYSLIAISLTACSAAKKQKRNEARSQAFLHQDIGMGYLRGQNYPAALKQLITANKLAPNEPSILNNLAVAYHYRGRSDISLKTLKKALSINPAFTEARTNLGRILIEEKKYSQAAKHLLTAREDLTYPNPEKVHSNLGVAYYYLSNYEKAQKELDLALKVDRNYCQAIVYKVKNMYYRKKYIQSARLADKAELSCPGRHVPEMVYLAGMGRFMTGRNDEAKNRFEKLVNKHPNSEFSQKAKLAISTLEME